jgi:hypothetical protein
MQPCAEGLIAGCSLYRPTVEQFESKEAARRFSSPAVEGALARKLSKPNGRQTSHLHPFIYKLIVGVAAWMALAAWGFFRQSGYIGLVLAVITGFLLVVVGIPYILWRIWRGGRSEMRTPAEREGEGSLGDWLNGDLDIWQGRLKGLDAMVSILLPLMAVAVGMTTFAILWRLVVDGFI